MKFRILATLLVVFMVSMVAWGQDATPTPVPPNCPSFPNESDEIRTSYYMGEGLGYFQSGQLSTAQNSFSCIIVLIDNDYVPAYMNRAAVYTSQRRYEQAIADYDEAIERDANLVAAYNNRGILYTALGEFEEATADFERVLSLDSTSIAGYNNKAVFQAIQGDVLGAIDTLNQAIDISGVDEQLAQLKDPNRPADAPEIKVDPIAARSYALLGIMYSKIALQNYDDYAVLTRGSGDFRIADAAGALESRFTFDLRLEDGTWWLTADYNSTVGN
jgi:tetratricopeptide (TPR) repeat protein